MYNEIVNLLEQWTRPTSFVFLISLNIAVISLNYLLLLVLSSLSFHKERGPASLVIEEHAT